MGDLEKMQPRPFKRNLFFNSSTFGRKMPVAKQNLDAAARRLYLMSFQGMGKSIQMIRAPTTRPTPQLIIRMSFQPAIPWRVALQHCPPLLHQPGPILPQVMPNSGNIRREKS
jgi:hypothetical protein